RKLAPEDLEKMSDGRVVEGLEAVKIKLADKIGTFEDTVNALKEKAKIQGEVKLAFLSRKPKGFFERIVHDEMSPVRQWMESKLKVLEYRWDPMGSVRK